MREDRHRRRPADEYALGVAHADAAQHFEDGGRQLMVLETTAECSLSRPAESYAIATK